MQMYSFALVHRDPTPFHLHTLGFANLSGNTRWTSLVVNRASQRTYIYASIIHTSRHVSPVDRWTGTHCTTTKCTLGSNQLTIIHLVISGSTFSRPSNSREHRSPAR